MTGPDTWGPFRLDVDEAERLACLRSLRALARVLAGPRTVELCRALAAAETNPDALEPAREALRALEPVDRRRILATYAALLRPAA